MWTLENIIAGGIVILAGIGGICTFYMAINKHGKTKKRGKDYYNEP